MVAFSCGAHILGVVDIHGDVYAWRLESLGEHPAILLAGNITGQSVCTLAFSPDEEYVVTGHKDGRIQCWAVVGGLPPVGKALWSESGVPVTALAISDDNRIVAVGGEDGSVHLRSLAPTGLKGNPGVLDGSRQ